MLTIASAAKKCRVQFSGSCEWINYLLRKERLLPSLKNAYHHQSASLHISLVLARAGALSDKFWQSCSQRGARFEGYAISSRNMKTDVIGNHRTHNLLIWTQNYATETGKTFDTLRPSFNPSGNHKKLLTSELHLQPYDVFKPNYVNKDGNQTQVQI